MVLTPIDRHTRQRRCRDQQCDLARRRWNSGCGPGFTIDVGNTNDGPSFFSTPVTDVDEDAIYTYNITVTDPDTGDTLTISAPTVPEWLTFADNGDGTAVLTGTPSNNGGRSWSGLAGQ